MGVSRDAILAKIAEHETRVGILSATPQMQEYNQRIGAIITLRELLPPEIAAAPEPDTVKGAVT